MNQDRETATELYRLYEANELIGQAHIEEIHPNPRPRNSSIPFISSQRRSRCWIMVQDQVLSTKYIEELLAVAGHVEKDNTGHLTKERDRLRGEVERLVTLAAQGVGSDSVGSAIREREGQIARIEVKLKQPRRVAPNIEALREALTQRAAEWRETLRAEPKVARLLLRKLIGPLELVDESQNPNFVDADTDIKPALLEGLQRVEKMASPTGSARLWTKEIPGIVDAA